MVDFQQCARVPLPEIAQAGALCAFSVGWTHKVVRGGTTAPNRLVRALPALLALHLTPLCFDPVCHPFWTYAAAGILAWWSAHKLLAFCMDRGNLPTAGTPAQVAFQLLLPAAFIAKEGTGESGAAVLARRLQEPARTLFLRGLAKLGTVMAFVLVLTRMRGGLHAVLNPCGGHAATKLGLPVCDWTAAPEQRMAEAPHVQLMMFSWIIFMFFSLVMDLPAALLQRIDSGAVMMPHFDEPYLSTSVREFWTLRWNISAGVILRQVVYEPLLDGWAGKPVDLVQVHRAQQHQQPPQQQQPAQLVADGSARVPPLKLGGGGGSGSKDAQQEQPHGGEPLASPPSSAREASTSGRARSKSGGGSARSRKGVAAASTVAPASAASTAGGSPVPSPAASPRTADATHTTGDLSGQLAAGTAAAAPAAAPPRAPAWVRALATMATFLVSGMEHELIMLYCNRAWNGRMLPFFTLHGAIVVAEAAAERWLLGPRAVREAAEARWGWPYRTARRVAVIAVMLGTAEMLWWPAFLRWGLDARLLREWLAWLPVPR